MYISRFVSADVENQLKVKPNAMVADDAWMQQYTNGLLCMQDGSNVDS